MDRLKGRYGVGRHTRTDYRGDRHERGEEGTGVVGGWKSAF